MQDKIVLGFLMHKDLTSYDIKKALDQSTSLFYNSSLGSIHPALKKNEKKGLIIYNEMVENGRAKKRYSITDSGRWEFNRWISESIPVGTIKDEAMLRLFFLGNLNVENRVKLLNDYIMKVDKELDRLYIKKCSFNDVKISENLKDVAQYQMATLQFGIDYFEFVKGWYSKIV